MKLAVIIITYLNVVRKCCCSCTDQNQQYEVESDRGADGREKQEQRIFHSLSSPFPPPLPCFLCFFSSCFSYVFFLTPLLPFFSTYSFSYVCFHHLFLFFILSTFWMSLLTFHFLFKFFFLHNHHPIFVFEFFC